MVRPELLLRDYTAQMGWASKTTLKVATMRCPSWTSGSGRPQIRTVSSHSGISASESVGEGKRGNRPESDGDQLDDGEGSS
jgi:hypothetical protein